MHPATFHSTTLKPFPDSLRENSVHNDPNTQQMKQIITFPRGSMGTRNPQRKISAVIPAKAGIQRALIRDFFLTVIARHKATKQSHMSSIINFTCVERAKRTNTLSYPRKRVSSFDFRSLFLNVIPAKAGIHRIHPLFSSFPT